MPGGGGGGGKSEPVFYEGQKDLAAALFGQSGPFWSLLGGGPDVGFERNAARGAQQLNYNLAQQGLTGSGLAAKAFSNYETDVQAQRQDNMMRVLLDAIQPAGARTVGGSKSLLGL